MLSLGQIDPGGLVPDADQLIGVGIGQRLQQYAVDHAEDDGIGADADRQRDERDGGEEGRARQSAENLLELIAEVGHAEPPLLCVDSVVINGGRSHEKLRHGDM